MTYPRFYALLAVAFLTVGCATPSKDAAPFSMAALPPYSPNYAVLVVYRQMVPPLAYKPTVSVNGQKAVEMPNDGFTWIKVKPGHVSLRNDWSFAAGNPSGAVDLDVEAGHYYYFEITGDSEQQYVNPIVHVAVNLATLHLAVQGRGLVLEEEAQAIKNLITCCRYVPLDNDYVPANYVPPAKERTPRKLASYDSRLETAYR